ncbi:MAG TPA: hypothetical protein VMN60_07765 [Longimicrobiales bacterium]|nr:hypothetical protein [Longimicrobiales bacterium]
MWSRRNARGLYEQLHELEQRAEHAPIPGANAGYMNEAGDLCLTSGDVMRALDYFGLAIDAHVRADRFTAAMALCRKVLRIQPEVVRARCTLAWLSIGNGFEGDACSWIGGYVDAAERVGRERLAVSQLRRMGELATGEQLRMLVGERLLALGDDRTADHIFGIAFGTRNGTIREALSDHQQRWSWARRAALLGPRELAA